MLSTKKWYTAGIGLLLGASLALAGCGGDSSSAGGSTTAAAGADVAAAQKVVDTATAAVTAAPTVPASPAKSSGKLVVTIPCSYAAEGCKRGVDAVSEAGATLGWNVQMIDPAGDPEKMRQAIRTAITLKADGIFLAATPPEVVAADVATARASGIKVVNMFEPSPDGFADADSLTDHVQAGRWDAAFVAVATGGAGKIITVNDPEFPSVTEWNQGFTEGIKELCPGCTIVQNMDFQIATLQTTVPQQFQAILQANPDVNAVWTAYDPVAAAITPVIERSANPDQITMVSHNGDPFAIDYIKAGDKPLKATVAYSIEWQSYAAADQMNRLLAGSLPADLQKINVPNKLLTANNITSNPWNGDVDWKSAYVNSWNAGS